MARGIVSKARARKGTANGSVRENGQAIEVTITHDPASVQQSQSKPARETSNKQDNLWVPYNGTHARFEEAKRTPLTDQRKAEIRWLRKIGVCWRCSRLKK